MKKSIYSIALVLMSVVLSSCSKESIRGEGPVETIVRADNIQQSFTSLKVNGEAEVYVNYGITKNLEIKGYHNLLPLFMTEVVNNKLILQYKEGYRVRNSNIKIYLTVPYVPAIEVNGSCEAEFLGDFPIQKEFYAEINGSGNVKYSRVEVGNTRFVINGSGNINAVDVISTESVVRISGSGDVKLTALEKLNVEISGSGKVFYKGRPIIEQKISGSGEIISL